MNIYCIEEFKVEFEKLISKKSYLTLNQDITEYFFCEKSINDLRSGTRLNNCDETPYIKKRLNGSGGFRIYFLLIIKEENVYLMFVHPKTGSEGAENIKDESKALLYKKVLDCIKSNDLYQITLNIEENKLNFNRL